MDLVFFFLVEVRRHQNQKQQYLLKLPIYFLHFCKQEYFHPWTDGDLYSMAPRGPEF